MTEEHPGAETLRQALRYSRFLSWQVEARPDLARELEAGIGDPLDEARLLEWLGPGPVAEDELKGRLRALRLRAFAHVAVRDLAGLADLREVTATMTALAELAVTTAIEVCERALRERHGAPLDREGRPERMIVVGMGKLGGGELNVSSDIDLIFVYPEDGETTGPSAISNFEFFTRLGRRVVEALAEPTADGRVFRVDMRLRPDGESGPLACSLEALENYFITQGREWERYAWIKARPIAGERFDELAAVARPFVFRKYLDFGALNAMRELHAQIRREVSRRELTDHIKLGPGGIREIEFIAQVFQLIRGGRESALQARPTIEVLELLAARGMLSASAVGELVAAYRFLRRLEHRLQYVEDAQTHTLPRDAADQALVAAAMGFADYGALAAELDDHRAAVSRHFDAVFAQRGRGEHELSALWSGAADDQATCERLRALGYREAQAVARRLAAVRGAARYQQMPANIRSRFDPLIPRVIDEAARRPNPDETLARTLDLLEAISRRGAYLALLQQYPQALARVCELAGASSWAAGYLTRHPVLLDELLDPRLIEAAHDWPALRAELSATLDAIEPDMERQMDVMREAHHAQVFRLLLQDLAGVLTVERLADHLSELADIMLDLTIATVWRKMRNRHRERPRFAVVSYGKLGGKELGYASDLDLIFLFDDAAPEAAERYARLAQRISTWLSSHTPAGILFETDLRLRPNGEAGLLVSSVRAFREYQTGSAWVWEHQALTRARFSAGDREVGRQFEDIRFQVLCQKRDPEALRREVLAMRARMLDAHANRSGLFDLKHDRGGLIDVEFAVQYLVLGYAHLHPGLAANLGNIALLRRAGDLGLIPAGLAAKAGDAYREYRRLQHALRLNGAAYARVLPESVAVHVACVRELWRTVFGCD
ncbi:MAG: bifunctional [glutamate--ammonia ligase]-adenylyl-L-tyrosine phosphorylase/[glutamate--ammonia-ligase] adenylyltransferase [Rhodocyclales bacterium CG17_big_fil_post_rev_8_21_14_2_50_68_7]|nr:MAG: bifunctional [glutamate--ammonia ligase]-adenylyl-L-tyrosine phosphorylase/[glutamate--ammonia-ligase] adenylyltransferase [Rhodocyclales bacterium CG17_big_fil_post_rev_8_21_14_2_50_68_7]PIX75564.1 MAG: bifunctional [glutamate--ammonia ligase]-adenylyl-L-tyrosine phosphorylase/[glutamate--ammonia-ligase] adenylyltransferase [Rhodocyclales bacterium CG_4_10_14_3_um_filter_68_10]